MKIFALAVVVLFTSPAWAQVGIDTVYSVEATGETEPVPSAGDAADDVCIWIHPTDTSLSTFIISDKQYCLQVCDLEGNQLQLVRDGKFNNVDLRYNFPLGDDCVDLVCASDRAEGTMRAYRVNPITRCLEDVTGAFIDPDGTPYGCALYREPESEKFYYLLTTLNDVLEQWELVDDGNGKVDAELVRTIVLPEQAEGVVADDEHGWIFVGVEDLDLRRYDADPDADDSFEVLDVVDTDVTDGHLVQDIEGLTIYYGSDGDGYLIASSQGAGEFVVYERTGDHDYVMTFENLAGAEIGRASQSDGIDVTNVDLGDLYPSGVFLAHDGTNSPANQNFKMIPWEDIAELVDPPLTIDTGFSLRAFNGSETVPAAPSDLEATVLPGCIELAWNEPTGDASILVCQVYRDGEAVALVEEPAYTDDSAEDGVEYTYEISAVSSGGVESEVGGGLDVMGAGDDRVPVLTGFEVGASEDYLALTFDEDVSFAAAAVELLDSEGSAVVTGAIQVAANRVVIETASLSGAEPYRLWCSGVEDIEGNRGDVELEFEYETEVRTEEQRISFWIDDAEEDIDGEMSVDDADVELGTDGDITLAGLRFPNLPLAQGAPVESAYIQFSADESGEQLGTILFEAEASDHGDWFVENDLNLSARPRTAASVSWDPAAWTVGDEAEDQQTPDLSEVVQEVIDRDGWLRGNALVILVSGDGLRVAESYDAVPDEAPMLLVEYTAAVTVYTLGGEFRRGDVNADGSLDLSDAIAHLHVLFASDFEIECQDRADSNDDGLLGLDDSISLLSFMFAGGDAPSDTFNQCARDATGDLLPCEVGASCL